MNCVIAAVRFGLGAGSADLQAMGDDPRAWLRSQLADDGASAAAPVRASSSDSLAALYESSRAIAEIRAGGNSRLMDDLREDKKQVIAGIKSEFRATAQDDMVRAVTTPQPFRERLSRFWVNHFAIVPRNSRVTALVPNFEEAAISPHIVGRFEDMLLAVIRHPAMQVYLDNFRSIGPGSPVGLKSGKGLNENLAREILELHTLGVDGGYAQADVIALASALTGWTVVGLGDGEAETAFSFQQNRHQPGAVEVLGKTYNEAGEKQAARILRDLARHPATARHLATKLVRHFVDDVPPPASVERIAAVYRETGGDLRAVGEALVALDDAWARPFTKLKQPADFVVSSLRALDLAPNRRLLRQAIEYQAAMGQPALNPPGPQGWYDTAADWRDPGSLRRRIDWSLILAAHGGDKLEPLEAAARNFGSRLDADTRAAIERAPSREEAAALFVASPLFQRR